MPNIIGLQPLDMSNLNLNRLIANYSGDFPLAHNTALHGTTYADVYETHWTYNGVTYASIFAGSGLTYPISGSSSGNVSFYSELYWDGSAWKEIYYLQGISVSEGALYNAASTPDTTDDYTLFKSALSTSNTYLLAPGRNVVYGYGVFNTFLTSTGDYTITGVNGTSTVVISASLKDLQIRWSPSADVITGLGSTYTLANVQKVNLNDGNWTLTHGSAGVDALTLQIGQNIVLAGDGADQISIGSTIFDNYVDGGSNVNTVVFSGLRSSYTVAQTAPGEFSISTLAATQKLKNIQFARFSDQTVRLLPGSGTVVDFGAQPAVYMGAIRDFDGNNLIGQGTQVISPTNGQLIAGSAWDGTSGWTLAGTADASGGGTQSRILFNNLIGRWAEVTPQASDSGKVYFNNYGWAGDTRVVGIYTDPEVALGHAVPGGPNDSQRRFQNDLFIGNIKSVLSAGDYNHDGFQEIYFSLNDGTAYLHAIMWNDGNVQYANYQSTQQVQDYFTANNISSSVWSSWLHEEPMQVFATTGSMAPLLGQEASPLASMVG